MLSSQYGTVFTRSHYEKLQKVYSIWICTNPPNYRANTVTAYSITEKNVYGSFQENKKNYDLLTLVMVCLGKSKTTKKSSDNGKGSDNGKDSKEKNDTCENILRLLNVLFSSDLSAKDKMDILEREFSIPMTEHFRKELRHMCNLSDEVERKGIKKGFKKGRESGRREGFLESIRSLMQTNGFTMEQSMDALCIPTAERPVYVKMLTNHI